MLYLSQHLITVARTSTRLGTLKFFERGIIYISIIKEEEKDEEDTLLSSSSSRPLSSLVSLISSYSILPDPRCLLSTSSQQSNVIFAPISMYC